jgi:D-alanyl-D-alanine carboxypeptidase (penicillin-binding protein 5/6)
MTKPHRCFAYLLAFLLLAGGSAQAIETAAKQAILVDFRTGSVLLDKNADELMPPSSMSKMMTIYMLFQRLKEGSIRQDDTLMVSEKAWRMGGSKMFVKVGDRVRVDDLINGIIVQSGNDACIVVAEGLEASEGAFADEMNRKGREIGLKASVFKNATGWPDPEHMTTARDLALIARRTIIDFPELYRFYGVPSFTYAGIKQDNRNLLLGRNLGVDGLKTGHTEAAGYGITATGVRDGRRLILVVNGLSSMKERAEEGERLLDWGFREFENVSLFQAGEVVTDAAVWLGAQPLVQMLAPQALEITIPRKSRRGLKVAAVFDTPVPAPVMKGTPIGKLVVSAPDMETREMPLIAAADVERLGFFGRIAAAVRYILWGPNG